MADAEYVVISDVEIKAVTKKALLCEIEGEEHWLPLSAVSDDCELSRKGDSGQLILAKWLAEKHSFPWANIEDED
jgi:hypothetical protein